MDRDRIKQRLEDAGRTLLRTPIPHNGFPMGHKSGWPEVVRNMSDLFEALVGMSEEERQQFWDAENMVRMRPSAKQIQQMEETLPLFFVIEDKRRRDITFARSLIHPLSERHIVSYAKLGRKYGIHKDTIRKWHHAGLDEILAYENKLKKVSPTSSKSSILFAIV